MVSVTTTCVCVWGGGVSGSGCEEGFQNGMISVCDSVRAKCDIYLDIYMHVCDLELVHNALLFTIYLSISLSLSL